MKAFNLIITVFFSVFANNALQSQDILKNIDVYAGMSFLNQDRRLFEFTPSYAADIIRYENTTLDWEASIFLQREWTVGRVLGINVGAGYNQYNSYFSRPFSKGILTEVKFTTLEGTLVGHYRVDRLMTPISINGYLTKKHTFFFCLFASPFFNLKKSIRDKTSDKKYKNWDFQFNGIEINPGLGFRLKKLTFQCSYRWFNLVRLDRVIFNHSLFNFPNPPFLQKEYDDYNPTKITFSVGYSLSK